MSRSVDRDEELDERVASVISRVVGWPSAGVRFTDVSTVWERHPEIFRALVTRMCDRYAETPPPILLTIEARAFLFAGAMAHVLGARVVMARKGPIPRLPRDVVTQEYVSGYEGGLVMGAHRDAVDHGADMLVVDDVLAAGWSAVGGVRLVEKLGGRCVGVAVAIELGHLPGRRNLHEHTGVPLFAAARTPELWADPSTP